MTGRILRLVLVVLFVGALTGVTVALLATPAPSAEVIRSSVAIGVTYTAIMATMLTVTAHAAARIRPPVTRGAVVFHIALQTVVTVVAFLVATRAVDRIFGVQFGRRTTMIVAVVAFAASVVVNVLYYSARFYEHSLTADRAAAQAELAALRAQVDPHFLFNSLNSIAALIRTRPAEAEEVTQSLADLFRYTLRASKNPAVTLGEELESVRRYLAIERTRFGKRLEIDIEVPASLGGAVVPALILQPLVENAVKHGAARTDGVCRIAIRAERRNGDILLLVTDTGPGFDSADVEVVMPRGSGLQNLRDRLRLTHGDRAALRIVDQGVELRVPARGIDGSLLRAG